MGLHKVNFVLIWKGWYVQMQPKVVCTFPIGELRAEEVEKDEERAIALSGFFGGSLLNGQVVASYTDENATLKYTFKVNIYSILRQKSLLS